MRVACRTRWRRPLVRRDLCLFPGDPGDPSEVEDSRPSSLAEKETLFADSGSSNSLSGVGELTAGGAAGSDVEIARVFAERPRDATRSHSSVKPASVSAFFASTSFCVAFSAASFAFAAAFFRFWSSSYSRWCLVCACLTT